MLCSPFPLRTDGPRAGATAPTSIRRAPRHRRRVLAGARPPPPLPRHRPRRRPRRRVEAAPPRQPRRCRHWLRRLSGDYATAVPHGHAPPGGLPRRRRRRGRARELRGVRRRPPRRAARRPAGAAAGAVRAARRSQARVQVQAGPGVPLRHLRRRPGG